MRLDALCRAVPGATIAGDPGVVVRDVNHDSRECGPGSLFVAIAGLHRDGLAYVRDALDRGAVAVVTDRPEMVSAPTVIAVDDPRRAVGQLAAELHGNPSQRLRVIGVTGTNGKTTTTFLLQSMLAGAGRRVGVIGTLGTSVSGELKPGRHTTPEASDIQRTMAGMVRAGLSDVAMEVSSHALAMGRVSGVTFGAAVFTNLSPEHLDFHHDLVDYCETKSRLFAGLGPDAVAIVNADDPAGDVMAGATRARVVTYGLERPARVRGEILTLDLEGTRMTLSSGDVSFTVRTSLVGRFNAANVLAAAAAALSLGVPPEAVARGVSVMSGVPGRFERVEIQAGGPAVFVDYAHTPDGLAKVLGTLRECTSGRVITVFGCGGDRDPHKRPVMGELAARLSDVVIITSDNPRTESPEEIAAAVLVGANRVGGDIRVMLDRDQAIGVAVSLARSDDAVMIAGKGHETYQIIGERTRPFDDRERARAALLRVKTEG